MDEMELLGELKDKIELHEFTAFHRRVTSLKSNLVYWGLRLNSTKAADRDEAKFETTRCENLMKKVVKDMEKAKQKAEE
jgi:hypothetical protein